MSVAMRAPARPAILAYSPSAAADPFGFRSTKMTESPRRNILLMKRSLLTDWRLFFPFPFFGTSVHTSFTSSSTLHVGTVRRG